MRFVLSTFIAIIFLKGICCRSPDDINLATFFTNNIATGIDGLGKVSTLTTDIASRTTSNMAQLLNPNMYSNTMKGFTQSLNGAMSLGGNSIFGGDSPSPQRKRSNSVIQRGRHGGRTSNPQQNFDDYHSPQNLENAQHYMSESSPVQRFKPNDSRIEEYYEDNQEQFQTQPPSRFAPQFSSQSHSHHGQKFPKGHFREHMPTAPNYSSSRTPTQLHDAGSAYAQGLGGPSAFDSDSRPPKQNPYGESAYAQNPVGPGPPTFNSGSKSRKQSYDADPTSFNSNQRPPRRNHSVDSYAQGHGEPSAFDFDPIPPKQSRSTDSYADNFVEPPAFRSGSKPSNQIPYGESAYGKRSVHPQEFISSVRQQRSRDPYPQVAQSSSERFNPASDLLQPIHDGFAYARKLAGSLASNSSPRSSKPDQNADSSFAQSFEDSQALNSGSRPQNQFHNAKSFYGQSSPHAHYKPDHDYENIESNDSSDHGYTAPPPYQRNSYPITEPQEKQSHKSHPSASIPFIPGLNGALKWQAGPMKGQLRSGSFQ